VRNPAKHRKLAGLIQPKPLPHPREEVRQAIVPSLHTLRDTSTSTGERKGADTIRSKHNVRICIGQVNLRFEYVDAIFASATYDFTVGKNADGGHLDTDIELFGDEVSDSFANGARTGEDNQPTGFGYLQVDSLP
jgi:hypothetical protein